MHIREKSIKLKPYYAVPFLFVGIPIWRRQTDNLYIDTLLTDITSHLQDSLFTTTASHLENATVRLTDPVFDSIHEPHIYSPQFARLLQR